MKKRNLLIIGIVLASIIVLIVAYSFGKKMGKSLYHHQNNTEKVKAE